jgi:hypothetical protein
MILSTLEIAATITTPKIDCDPDKGLILMEGNSYPENSFEFFKDLLIWIETYLDTQTTPLTLELRLVYLNTSSAKIMVDIFDMLEEAYAKGHEVKVYWFYDSRNERVVGSAEEFKEDCTFPFLITATENNSDNFVMNDTVGRFF